MLLNSLPTREPPPYTPPLSVTLRILPTLASYPLSQDAMCGECNARIHGSGHRKSHQVESYAKSKKGWQVRCAVRSRKNLVTLPRLYRTLIQMTALPQLVCRMTSGMLRPIVVLTLSQMSATFLQKLWNGRRVNCYC